MQILAKTIILAKPPINETLKHLCLGNSFIFVKHENISFDNLWINVFHKSATENDISDVKKGLKENKIHSPDKLILSHLNISSVRNKFEALTYIIYNNIDLLLISETKLDDSFPRALSEVLVFHIDMSEIEKAVNFFCTFARIYSLNY